MQCCSACVWCGAFCALFFFVGSILDTANWYIKGLILWALLRENIHWCQCLNRISLLKGQFIWNCCSYYYYFLLAKNNLTHQSLRNSIKKAKFSRSFRHESCQPWLCEGIAWYIPTTSQPSLFFLVVIYLFMCSNSYWHLKPLIATHYCFC